MEDRTSTSYYSLHPSTPISVRFSERAETYTSSVSHHYTTSHNNETAASMATPCEVTYDMELDDVTSPFPGRSRTSASAGGWLGSRPLSHVTGTAQASAGQETSSMYSGKSNFYDLLKSYYWDHAHTCLQMGSPSLTMPTRPSTGITSITQLNDVTGHAFTSGMHERQQGDQDPVSLPSLGKPTEKSPRDSDERRRRRAKLRWVDALNSWVTDPKFQRSGSFVSFINSAPRLDRSPSSKQTAHRPLRPKQELPKKRERKAYSTPLYIPDGHRQRTVRFQTSHSALPTTIPVEPEVEEPEEEETVTETAEEDSLELLDATEMILPSLKDTTFEVIDFFETETIESTTIPIRDSGKGELGQIKLRSCLRDQVMVERDELTHSAKQQLRIFAADDDKQKDKEGIIPKYNAALTKLTEQNSLPEPQLVTAPKKKETPRPPTPPPPPSPPPPKPETPPPPPPPPPPPRLPTPPPPTPPPPPPPPPRSPTPPPKTPPPPPPASPPPELLPKPAQPESKQGSMLSVLPKLNRPKVIPKLPPKQVKAPTVPIKPQQPPPKPKPAPPPPPPPPPKQPAPKPTPVKVPQPPPPPKVKPPPPPPPPPPPQPPKPANKPKVTKFIKPKPVKVVEPPPKPKPKVTRKKAQAEEEVEILEFLPISKPDDSFTEEDFIDMQGDEQHEEVKRTRSPIKKKERVERKTPPPPTLEPASPEPPPPIFIHNKRGSIEWSSDEDDNKLDDVDMSMISDQSDASYLSTSVINPELPTLDMDSSRSRTKKVRHALQINLNNSLPRRGVKKVDLDYELEQERLRLAEERQRRQQMMYNRLKARNRISLYVEQETIERRISFQECDFLSKYCIFPNGRWDVYRGYFERVDVDGRGWLSRDETVEALRYANNELTGKEEAFLYRVLEMAGYNVDDGADAKLFSIIAALSHRISSLDSWMKLMIADINFQLLEMKMFLCKNLWEICVDKLTKRISIDQLIVELRSGGISSQNEENVKEKLGRLHSMDLLDFLTYSPLFIMIHTSVVSNPLLDYTDRQ